MKITDDIGFVFVSLQRINTDRESTSTHLAKELSKNHRVLYINPPIDRKTYIFKKDDRFVLDHITEIKEKKENFSSLDNNLWMYNPHTIMESINWIPSTRIFSVFNRINNRAFADEIKEAIEKAGIKKYILINDKDIFRSYYLKEFLRPLYSIYLYRDYTLAMDYWKKHGASLEPQLMKDSDGVVCNSYGFTELAKSFNPHSYFIGNGCNTSLFNGTKSWKVPGDLQHIPKPIIGYAGALTDKRLDIDLLVEIAMTKPEWSIALIGKEYSKFSKSKLHKMPNVYFLGHKSTGQLPAYISGFDVCINPQAVNDLTNDNYPLKIDEYLAMGRPVVATETKTMKEIFKDYTYLARSAEMFIQNIEKAMMENTMELQASRITFANTHNWKNVTGRFTQALQMIIN